MSQVVAPGGRPWPEAADSLRRMVADPDSYYLRTGERRFTSTPHTEGAWLPGEQHMAPVSGLMVHAIERELSALSAAASRSDEPGPELLISRLTFEILGVIAAGEMEIEVSVIRPGRTIQLIEATMIIAGRPTIRARVWRLARRDTASVSGGAPDPLPSPDGLERWAASDQWRGGYIRSLEIRPLPGGKPGRAAGWLRTPIALVHSEPVSDLARFIGLVDTANGIAVRRDPREWMFPNLELTIHLYRQPVWGWVGLDTSVIFGDGGVGLTTSVLHDVNGPVGRVEQLLTVRPLPTR